MDGDLSANRTGFDGLAEASTNGKGKEQMIARIVAGLLGASLLLVLSAVGAAAADAGDRKVVGGVLIYMGILPAEMIRGHPAEHPETSMHGGKPKASNQYHVMVALFDAKTLERISDARVSARVAEVGLAGDEKPMEAMNIADTITYGNYFRMAGHGPFRISLIIRIPGEPHEIKADFEHRHQ